MKKINRYVLLCLSLTLFILIAGCQNIKYRANHDDTWNKIEKRGKMVVGLDDSFVPMGFRQKNGQLVGYDIDLAKAVGKKLGLKVSFQTIDWSMKETELRNGTIDMIWNGYTATPQRAKTVAFSNRYLSNKQVLVVSKHSGINDYKDMQGKILGVQSGSSGYNDLMNDPKVLKDRVKSIIQYDTFNNAFMDLRAKRTQGVLIDSVYAYYYLSHTSSMKDFKVIANVPFPSEGFVVGMRKGDKTLKRKIDLALQQLQQDGTIAKIQRKWFSVER